MKIVLKFHTGIARLLAQRRAERMTQEAHDFAAFEVRAADRRALRTVLVDVIRDLFSVDSAGVVSGPADRLSQAMASTKGAPLDCPPDQPTLGSWTRKPGSTVWTRSTLGSSIVRASIFVPYEQDIGITGYLCNSRGDVILERYLPVSSANANIACMKTGLDWEMKARGWILSPATPTDAADAQPPQARPFAPQSAPQAASVEPSLSEALAVPGGVLPADYGATAPPLSVTPADALLIQGTHAFESLVRTWIQNFGVEAAPQPDRVAALMACTQGYGRAVTVYIRERGGLGGAVLDTLTRTGMADPNAAGLIARKVALNMAQVGSTMMLDLDKMLERSLVQRIASPDGQPMTPEQFDAALAAVPLRGGLAGEIDDSERPRQ